MMTHRFIHETIVVSAPFIVALIGLAVTCALAGLIAASSRRFSPASRHLILSTALFAAPLAALLTVTPVAGALRAWITPAPAPTATPVTTIDRAVVATTSPVRESELGCLLILAWLTGTTAFALLRIRQWLVWKRAARQAVVPNDAALLDSFEKQARGTPARLAISEAATEPMVAGLFRPVVLLPEGYAESLDPRELETVFAHEIEHVRRRDNFSAAIHEMVATIFWFDPLHWIAGRRLLELRERACDQRVLDRGCPPRSYIAALAKSCHAAIETPAVACMSGFQIRERIEAIMNYPSERSRFLPHLLIRLAALVGGAAMLASFAAIVPSPSFATTAPQFEDPPYILDVRIKPLDGNRVIVTAAVMSRDQAHAAEKGDVRKALAAMRMITSPGVPVGMSTQGPGPTYHISVTPDSTGGVATLEVRDGENVVYRKTQTVAMEADPASKAEPISIDLKDADILDVLRTFSALTGRPITADPSVKGRVSINVTNVPWDVALKQVVGQLGFTYETTGDAIRIVPPAAPASRSGPPYRVGGDVKAPQVLSRVEPVYTAEAKTARIAGVVLVEVLVDENGVVRATKVLKPLPFGLTEAAEGAVKRWVFSPAVMNGKPVPVLFTVTIDFRPKA